MSCNAEKQTKNILITGSSGYLGQHLVFALCTLLPPPSPNTELVITAAYGSLSSFPNAIESLQSNDKISPHIRAVNAVHVDLSDSTSVRQLIQSTDPHVIVHLAALSSPAYCQSHPEDAKRINCPTHLIDALQSSSSSNSSLKFIFLSTDQVYDGENPPYTEKAPQQPPPQPINIYGQTKLAFENALLQTLATKKKAVVVVILRSSLILGPPTPLGPCNKQSFVQWIHKRLVTQKEPTDVFTDEIRSVIHVHDVIQVIQHFVIHDADTNGNTITGVYNMGGPENVSRMDVALAVAKQCNVDNVGSLLKGVERSKLEIAITSPSPRDISMDSSKLRKLMGMDMMGLEEIVRKCF